MVEQRRHPLARGIDTVLQLGQLRGHLRQKLNDAAGSGRAGQCAGLPLLVGKALETLLRALDVGQQALGGKRVLVRLIEISGVVFECFREMLF